MLVGYARVSTSDQDARNQADRLTAAGCSVVYRETASGASRARPELAEALRSLGRGDTLVVVKIDRLARSVAHLLEIISDLKERGIGFRTLDQPIDTGSPVGNLTLQILGAVAEFERELIRERTRDGLARARAARKIGKGLRTHSPETKQRVSISRRRGHFEKLEASAHLWLPTVERLRPNAGWETCARALAKAHPSGEWTAGKLERAVRTMVAAKQASPDLLRPSPRSEKRKGLLEVIGGWLHEDPKLTLSGVRDRLHAGRFRTGRNERPHLWQLSSVGELVRRAREQGLAPPKPEGRRGKKQIAQRPSAVGSAGG